MRAVCAALLLTGAVVAVVLVTVQQPFADSRFEWDQTRDFTGVLRTAPVPMLVGVQPWLLVGAGKHGVGDALGGLDGRNVRLRGSLIERGDQRAIEVQPDSIQPGAVAAPRGTTVVIGPAELTGEIVDSKCYLGVMNPGSGKVHRDCAVRCLSGGVPLAFLVRDRHGRGRTLLLASESGAPLLPRILSRVAEPVRLTGTLESTDGVLIFRIRE
jgi:hypothetical protein